MNNEIAVIAPPLSGGVKTLLQKLVTGLRNDGFSVRVFRLEGVLPYLLYRDFVNVQVLQEMDTVVYVGSIPLPSHLVLTGPKTMLFVHGYVEYETVRTIAKKVGSPRTFLGLALPLLMWKITAVLGSVDHVVCHSLTACELNNVLKNSIILPQFVLSHEIESLTKLRSRVYSEDHNKETIRIVTYSSRVESPRLLTMEDIVRIVFRASKYSRRRVELWLVDPHSTRKEIRRHGNLIVRRVGWLERQRFLRLLAGSDLYIERCIDEELGFGAIEAGVLGVPIAKLTLPKYLKRQDYDENDVLLASSSRDLVRTLAEYFVLKEYYKTTYSKNIVRFITTKRIWDRVKHVLVNLLKA